jgi:3-dehydroquinate synthase
MSLNMGHTVGHAIETMGVVGVLEDGARRAPGLKHGEAVALGLIAEAGMGEAIGVTRVGVVDELREVFDLIGLPTRVEGLTSVGAVRDGMLDDKKVGEGKIRLAVPTGKSEGGCEIVVAPEMRVIEAGLRKIVAS